MGPTLTRNQHDAIEAVLVSSAIYDQDGGFGGINNFDGVGQATLEEILSYVPDEMRYKSRQNYSPTLQGFVELVEEFPDMWVFGYLVEPTRPDCRFAIEGFKIRAKDVDNVDRLVAEVRERSRWMPDEFHIVTEDGRNDWDRDLDNAEGEEVIRAWWD